MSKGYGDPYVASNTTGFMETRKKLKALCKERNWSQAQLLREAGSPIADSTYSQYLKSETADLALKPALAIAKALQVDLDWLADDETELPPPPAESGVKLSEREEELLKIARHLGYERALGRLLGAPVVGDFGPLP